MVIYVDGAKPGGILVELWTMAFAVFSGRNDVALVALADCEVDGFDWDRRMERPSVAQRIFCTPGVHWFAVRPMEWKRLESLEGIASERLGHRVGILQDIPIYFEETHPYPTGRNSPDGKTQADWTFESERGDLVCAYDYKERQGFWDSEQVENIYIGARTKEIALDWVKWHRDEHLTQPCGWVHFF